MVYAKHTEELLDKAIDFIERIESTCTDKETVNKIREFMVKNGYWENTITHDDRRINREVPQNI
jgi:hypothetical protein